MSWLGNWIRQKFKEPPFRHSDAISTLKRIKRLEVEEIVDRDGVPRTVFFRMDGFWMRFDIFGMMQPDDSDCDRAVLSKLFVQDEFVDLAFVNEFNTLRLGTHAFIKEGGTECCCEIAFAGLRRDAGEMALANQVYAFARAVHHFNALRNERASSTTH